MTAVTKGIGSSHGKMRGSQSTVCEHVLVCVYRGGRGGRGGRGRGHCPSQARVGCGGIFTAGMEL